MNIINEGRTSITEIRNDAFYKQGVSFVSYAFQKEMYDEAIMPYGFNINKPMSFSHNEASYEVIEHRPWSLDNNNVALIGKAMANIHNWSSARYDAGELQYLKVKYSPKIDDIGRYDVTPSSLDIRNDALAKIKANVFKNTTGWMPVHRDFRLHNILFNGDTYHLTDFDYAAIDIPSHEIIGMMLDVSQHGIGFLESFIGSYIQYSNITIDSSIVDDHLYYLATDVFPYDRPDRLSKENYSSLVDERDGRIMRLTLYYDLFKEIIDESLELNKK
jgi:hypothetical protein